jgi:CHASE1-domain containing sensor protein
MMKRTRVLVGLTTLPFVLLLSMGLSAGASEESVETIVGEQQAIGNGHVRTWL